MNSNKKLLTIITILLVLCTCISASYAFFRVASSNNNANSSVTINGVNLCMSLQLSSNNVTLSNEYAVPVSDAKALSSDVYKTEVTIQNNCGDAQSFNLLLIPNSSNTMPIKALKYALVEEGVTPTSGTLITNEYILDSTIQKQLLSIKNETLKNGFSVGSGTVNANTTKTFNLYLWIDKDEGSLGNGSTMDKILNAYLTLGSGSNIGTKLIKGGLYQTIENRYNQDKTYLGLYTGDGADDYPLPVYYYKGDVKNNNVLFGGFCWKIVRTTETGGVKIVYNGKSKYDYQSFDENEYANLTNDANYPYTFDSTNKTWTSTNTGTNNSTITFTVSAVGNYILNYDISMYDFSKYMDKDYYLNFEVFKDDISQGQFTGTTKGQIIFNELNPSNIIKIVFTRKVDKNYDRNNVIFNVGKLNSKDKKCNNTGEYSEIGTSKFNESGEELSKVGYMYNVNYLTSTHTIINRDYLSGTTAYADSVTYDSSTSTYTLDSSTATTLESSSNGNTLVGKYTCNQSTPTSTCKNAYYVLNYDGGYIYYYLLTDGDMDGTDNGQEYVFGKSFTYSNGMYTLSNTASISSDEWLENKASIDGYHYTCFNNETTCTSIGYIYYFEYGYLIYTSLSGGKSINDALNEMLYADDVNKTDSTIKLYIDDWYKNNLINNADKLEDTVFCNDRSIINLGNFDPNGKSIENSDLNFNNLEINNRSLICINETDRFSTNNTKAKLKYPIGLLSVPEILLSEYGSNHYLYTGRYTWLSSPAFFSLHHYQGSSYYGRTAGKIAGGNSVGTGYISSSYGVRPSVSLKPGTEFASGDGSFTSPFVIE